MNNFRSIFNSFVIKIVAVGFIVIAIGCVSILGISRQADALRPFNMPFGGPLLTVVPCDGGLWITVGPPAILPNSFIILAGGTLVYRYGAFHPGANVIGTWDEVGIPCIVGVVPVGFGVHVLMIGTSL